MKVYSGKLSLKRTTHRMLVYANGDLTGQYIPKSLLQGAGLKEAPAQLVFVLKTPTATETDQKTDSDRDIKARHRERRSAPCSPKGGKRG